MLVTPCCEAKFCLTIILFGNQVIPVNDELPIASKSKVLSMTKRIFNIVAWILTLAASVLAIGGFNGPGKDLFIFLSVSVLAGIAILLFRLGGSSCTENAASAQDVG